VATEWIVDDEELARQALAADPETPVSDDAVPFEGMTHNGGFGLLPGWYMPTPATRSAPIPRWQRIFAWVVIAALIAIVSAGLCSTDGYVTLA